MADFGTIEMVGLEQAFGWKGHRLDELTGVSVGRVDGVFIDAVSELPEWLVVRLGRFGHHTLVPARDGVEGVARVWVPFTREVIRRAPKIDPIASLTASEEQALLDHYGIGAAAGRALELAQRDPDTISVRPGDQEPIEEPEAG